MAVVVGPDVGSSSTKGLAIMGDGRVQATAAGLAEHAARYCDRAKRAKESI
jgi:hypothetical protein